MKTRKIDRINKILQDFFPRIILHNSVILSAALLLCVFAFSGCQDGQLRTADGMWSDPLDHPAHTGSTNTFKTYPERK